MEVDIITGMPDLGMPPRRNVDDTGVGGSENSSYVEPPPQSPAQNLRAIEFARIERDTLYAVLQEQCVEMENHVDKTVAVPFKTT